MRKASGGGLLVSVDGLKVMVLAWQVMSEVALSVMMHDDGGRWWVKVGSWCVSPGGRRNKGGREGWLAMKVWRVVVLFLLGDGWRNKQRWVVVLLVLVAASSSRLAPSTAMGGDGWW
ncbi:hypothetical protein Dimus_035065 [Dionaea muscipula]